MNRNLFVAWYCLGVLALCFATFLISLSFGMKWEAAKGAFGFLGFLGFIPFFLLGNNRMEKLDERDALFWQRAASCGFAFGCAVTGLIIATQILVLRFLFEVDSVPLSFLELPLLCGIVIGVFSFSLSMFHSYYKDKHTEHGGQNVS
jgi:hypothetical protein